MAFYFGILGYPFRRSSFPRACVQSVLLGLTQVVHLVGYASERYGVGSAPERASAAATQD